MPQVRGRAGDPVPNLQGQWRLLQICLRSVHREG
jgi:hypothetical protein